MSDADGRNPGDEGYDATTDPDAVPADLDAAGNPVTMDPPLDTEDDAAKTEREAVADEAAADAAAAE